jgi:hypothetical protein
MLVALVIWPQSIQASQTEPPDSNGDPVAEEAPALPIDAEWARLVDLELAIEDRRDAADRLIRLCEDSNLATQIGERLLHPDLASQDALDVFLQRVASSPRPPAPAGTMLLELVDRAPQRVRPALFGAIGRFRTRECVGRLIEELQKSRSPEQAEPIWRALVDITGHDDFGADPSAWSAWFESNRFVPDLEWQRELTSGLASNRDRLQASRRAIVTRLVDLSRAMYLTLEAGPQRSARLAELLGDEEPAIRQLGFDLARRELLAASGSLNADVGQAGVRLLDSTDANVRAQAAELVVQLGPPGGEEAITLALAKEQSARAAAPMLAGIVRWPNSTAKVSVLSWLGRDDELTRSPATGAALALARAALFDDEQLAEVLDVLRRRPDAVMGAPSIRLLALIGEPDDWERIARFLTNADPERRRAAAEVLAPLPAFGNRIVEAAAQSSDLFRFAVEIKLNSPMTLRDYDLIASLPAPDERTRQEALVRMAVFLGPDDLVSVAEAAATPADRHALLSTLLGREKQYDVEATNRCLLMLAETELALAHPERALEALEHMPVANADPRVTNARAIALLAMGRFDEGSQLDVGPDPWIRALEICVKADHAPDLLARLEERFKDLDDARRSAVAELAAVIAKNEEDKITDADSGG